VPDAATAGLVRAFSPTALAFAGVVVATGLLASWLHLGSFAALWQSVYGRILLLKLALLVVVFGAGAYNWLRVRPALGAPPAAARLRRSAAVELATAAAVLAVTAALVSTPPPAEPAHPAREDAPAAHH
jgi:copper transport protein